MPMPGVSIASPGLDEAKCTGRSSWLVSKISSLLVRGTAFLEVLRLRLSVRPQHAGDVQTLN